jgi:DNA primase
VKHAASSRASLEAATAAYETFLPMAEDYLAGRGIELSVAATYRLGVVVEPEVGHEYMVGRLSIPYITRAGVVDLRFRCMEEHDCKVAEHPKYLGQDAAKTHLYNVGALIRAESTVAITEGEIDALVLDGIVGIPAVGVPGATSWKEHYPRCFDDFERVLVFADGDKAGNGFARKLAHELETVTIVRMPEGMDVNEFYAQEGPDRLRERAGVAA